MKQVEWAVQLAERHGRKVATADEARQIMKVGVYYDSVEDTLTRLGLPPNRAEGQTGFLTYERTDGKRAKGSAAPTQGTSIL